MKPFEDTRPTCRLRDSGRAEARSKSEARPEPRPPGSAVALVASAMLSILAAGCREGGTRAEVVGNGQGGVEIRRVANDPPPPNPATRQVALDKSRIEALEAQVREQRDLIELLQAQVRQLKQLPATAPAGQ